MTKSTIVLIVLAVVAISLWSYYAQVRNSEPAVNSPAVLPIASNLETTSTTKGEQKPVSLTYSRAVNLYANSRIQFDSDCHANPTSLHIKNGSNLMLDNRSSSTAHLVVNGTKYSLVGFGFRIISLSHKTLPYTASVDCGSGKNNAQILLQ